VKFKFSEAGVSPEAVFTGREASYTDFISEDMGRLLLRPLILCICFMSRSVRDIPHLEYASSS
jgi:hypothetical protein